jgi:hypothetical protein
MASGVDCAERVTSVVARCMAGGSPAAIGGLIVAPNVIAVAATAAIPLTSQNRRCEVIARPQYC